MGYTDEPKIETMASLSANYLVNTMSDSSFHGWHALAENAPWAEAL
jgi:hypothetical protein